MATDDIAARSLKSYLRRKFSDGGGGVVYNGVTYPDGETGIKAFADAVWADGAYDNVIITQSGFEGGYATGSKGVPRAELLQIIEEIIEELGFGPTTPSVSQMMIFADYSGGRSST